MPRRARRESATGFYHIVSRGLDRENIFGEKREKTRFLNLLKDNLKDCNIEIYAYCVMSNHFHLLAKAEKELNGKVEKFIKTLREDDNPVLRIIKFK